MSGSSTPEPPGGLSPQDEPPEVPRDTVTVFHGSSFALSDAAGDIVPGTLTGVFHADTRHLSRFELRLGDVPLMPLTCGQEEPYEAGFFLTNPTLPSLPAETMSVERRRRINGRLTERITVHNHANDRVATSLAVAFDVDFADVFEVKERRIDKRGTRSMTHDPAARSMQFSYERNSFRRVTRVRFSQEPMFAENQAVFPISVPGRGRFTLWIDVDWGSSEANEADERPGGAPAIWTRSHVSLGWRRRLPRLVTDSDALERIWERSVIDLTALRLEIGAGDRASTLPAAGLPWFMAVFGRDTLITSYQTLFVAPELAKGALEVLAELQGRGDDPFRDEEPGKIMHELRHGELTACGDAPQSPYYGSIDATPLWLVLLSAYHAVTGDAETVRRLWPNATRALAWLGSNIDRYGGLLTYETRSPTGLANQGWKDSGTGVRFGDGSIAEAPIAICEAQGYAYAALRGAARLSDDVIGDGDAADRLRAEADGLRERFGAAFWTDDRGGHYVLGLDKDGRQIDSLTSNIGHLLWSGIADPSRAEATVERLFSSDLWSGWGVRTTAYSDGGYSPLGYHTGTVWPHDNSIISAGLTRYGFREHAGRIASSMLEAAAYRGDRLPEAFAGYSRSDANFPVRYPTASDPQAWATAAPFLWISLMLGLDVRDGALVADAMLPAHIEQIELHDVPAAGRRWTVCADRTGSEVTEA